MQALVFERLLAWFVSVGHSKTKSHLEVERKFKISDQSAPELSNRLHRMGFAFQGLILMTDKFLPTKNSKDMLRIRVEQEHGSKRTILTLKTWIKTDDGGRERKEAERTIGNQLGKVLLAVGRLLSGSELLSFSKKRQIYAGHVAGVDVVVSLDDVSGLGRYSGFYIEIEILVPVGGDIDQARQVIHSLAADLLGDQMAQVEMSYLDMLRHGRQ